MGNPFAYSYVSDSIVSRCKRRELLSAKESRLSLQRERIFEKRLFRFLRYEKNSGGE